MSQSLLSSMFSLEFHKKTVISLSTFIYIWGKISNANIYEWQNKMNSQKVSKIMLEIKYKGICT